VVRVRGGSFVRVARSAVREPRKEVRRLLQSYVARRNFRQARSSDSRDAAVAYWSRHTVLPGAEFSHWADSVESFLGRCKQYPGYLDLMPVHGFDGARVLDFGCGPGHDLVGFVEFSRPAALFGADVSPTALAIASARLSLHRGSVDLRRIEQPEDILPTCSDLDYIHCSGVLHHLADPARTLRALRQAVKPDGRARVMVYNRDSVWYHLYAGYVLPVAWKALPQDTGTDEVFRMSTDGPQCPISDSYTAETFRELATYSGWHCETVGAAMSVTELELCRDYLDRALNDDRLDLTHRSFLESLSWRDGVPHINGRVAGIDLVLELRPAV
jgi:SAM-dependent methyltransferase